MGRYVGYSRKATPQMTESDIQRQTMEIILRTLVQSLITRSDRPAYVLRFLRDDTLAAVNRKVHDEPAQRLLRTSVEQFYQELATAARIDPDANSPTVIIKEE